MPVLTFSIKGAGSVPASAARSFLSTVAICEAFATESLGRPVIRLGRSVLPGADARARLLVNTHNTTVFSLLALTSFLCNTTAG